MAIFFEKQGLEFDLFDVFGLLLLIYANLLRPSAWFFGVFARQTAMAILSARRRCTISERYSVFVNKGTHRENSYWSIVLLVGLSVTYLEILLYCGEKEVWSV